MENSFKKFTRLMYCLVQSWHENGTFGASGFGSCPEISTTFLFFRISRPNSSWALCSTAMCLRRKRILTYWFPQVGHFGSFVSRVYFSINEFPKWTQTLWSSMSRRCLKTCPQIEQEKFSSTVSSFFSSLFGDIFGVLISGSPLLLDCEPGLFLATFGSVQRLTSSSVNFFTRTTRGWPSISFPELLTTLEPIPEGPAMGFISVCDDWSDNERFSSDSVVSASDSKNSIFGSNLISMKPSDSSKTFSPKRKPPVGGRRELVPGRTWLGSAISGWAVLLGSGWGSSSFSGWGSASISGWAVLLASGWGTSSFSGWGSASISGWASSSSSGRTVRRFGSKQRFFRRSWTSDWKKNEIFCFQYWNYY